MSKELLIIFVKPPIIGKVKTRLAKSVGPSKALSIYEKLIKHTFQTVRKVPQEKYIAYSDIILHDDLWDQDNFQKVLQQGKDLGEKMSHAFQEGFNNSYQHICLIGSDIYELTPSVLEQAFQILKSHDLVLGPASDGGYYLIGMKQLYYDLFKDVPWGTEHVLEKTIKKAENHGLTVAQLPLLNDIDELDDIRDEDRNYFLG